MLVNNESKARYYLNPIMVETKPIIDSDWQNQYYRYEFGTINGVSVCYNLGKNESLSGDYQCVELCKRYIVEQYDFITPITSSINVGPIPAPDAVPLPFGFDDVTNG